MTSDSSFEMPEEWMFRSFVLTRHPRALCSSPESFLSGVDAFDSRVAVTVSYLLQRIDKKVDCLAIHPAYTYFSKWSI
jgi:hypothetical protein